MAALSTKVKRIPPRSHVISTPSISTTKVKQPGARKTGRMPFIINKFIYSVCYTTVTESQFNNMFLRQNLDRNDIEKMIIMLSTQISC